ncbi:deacetylase SIR2 [Aerococcaceae bacterium 50-4]
MWKSFENEIDDQAEILKTAVEEADAVVIGIGAGMSAADGFTYVGPRFEDNFPDFIEKYGFFDMLQASLFDFPSTQEYWAFESRFIALNYLDQPVGASYIALKELLANKAHHIITTNADNAFAAADYDMDKVFHIQGEYILMQCSQMCHQETYRDDDLIRRMVAEQEDMAIPYDLIPHCPKCGAVMEVNKRKAGKGMVESPDFFAQKDRYDAFLADHEGEKILFLDIGVGYTTPQFVKTPFQEMTKANPNAMYVPMNKKRYRIPDQLKGQTYRLDADIAETIIGANALMQAGVGQ